MKFSESVSDGRTDNVDYRGDSFLKIDPGRKTFAMVGSYYSFNDAHTQISDDL